MAHLTLRKPAKAQGDGSGQKDGVKNRRTNSKFTKQLFPTQHWGTAVLQAQGRVSYSRVEDLTGAKIQVVLKTDIFSEGYTNLPLQTFQYLTFPKQMAFHYFYF